MHPGFAPPIPGCDLGQAKFATRDARRGTPPNVEKNHSVLLIPRGMFVDM